MKYIEKFKNKKEQISRTLWTSAIVALFWWLLKLSTETAFLWFWFIWFMWFILDRLDEIEEKIDNIQKPHGNS